MVPSAKINSTFLAQKQRRVVYRYSQQQKIKFEISVTTIKSYAINISDQNDELFSPK